jgi:lipopolysaccharide export system permease protein
VLAYHGHRTTVSFTPMLLPIVDRYVLTEVLKTFLAIVVTLILIVSSLLFLRTLEEVNVGALNADLVLRFLGLQIVRDTSSLLPPAFFLAALGAQGRMARDSELVALNACGIGPSRMFRALFILAVPIALLTGWFALLLQPWAAAGIAEIRLQQRDQGTQIAGLQAGRFYTENGGNVVVYIGAMVKGSGLSGVFALDRSGGTTRVVVSETGRHRLDEETGDHLVTLNDGHRFDGNAGQGNYLIGRFREYQLRIEGAGSQPTVIKRSTTPSLELLHSGAIEDRAELEHRIAAPLAIFTLTLIAVPLVAISPRQKTTGRVLLAFLAYFTFFNLQQLAESWLASGTTPPWLTSFWYQVLVLGLVYLVLAMDSPRYRQLRAGLLSRTRLVRS